ncbi:phage tail protein [Pimelobacter simplex]|uniref:phage tail protein n=1 Tax=Nocardioides simplex TaxID=2045 RepID=UPI0019344D2D|nr:phage tail protein [Pimelobacter simplex]
MADPFVAEIRIFPFNFAPTGWAFCDGQLMPISQNTALFSLLGTMYGGDGKSTFALPNLQGAAPLGQGQGPGLTERFVGEASGTRTVTLLESEIPAHTHTLRADTADLADTSTPNPNASFALSSGGTLYQASSNGHLAFSALSVAGGSLPHNNMQPYLTFNFCIALQGVFPARG